jgi:hypothetical protein
MINIRPNMLPTIVRHERHQCSQGAQSRHADGR